MRSIWKGSIAFGLVNVPVKVYTATEDHDIKFHQNSTSPAAAKHEIPVLQFVPSEQIDPILFEKS